MFIKVRFISTQSKGLASDVRDSVRVSLSYILGGQFVPYEERAWKQNAEHKGRYITYHIQETSTTPTTPN